MYTQIQETTKWLQNNIPNNTEIAIILGSGLGDFAETIDEKKEIPYKGIPNFPVSTVEGHKGQLICGNISGKNIIAMQGRFHYYEGYSMKQVTFPIRIFKALGIKTLLISNAAGAIRKDFNPGDIMIIKDHINTFPENPLRGPNLNEFGTRFPDMGETYTPEIINKALKISKKNNIQVETGIYLGTQGPNYETPAEINYFRSIGADAVGMSTIPEVLVAKHCGMNIFAISVITNSTGDKSPVLHEEVQKAAEKAKEKIEKIFTELIRTL